MSRTSRIPYHQNVYDLLQIEPGESPEAARMIAEHEAQYGSLPASVREWYLVPNAVPLRAADGWTAEKDNRTISLEYCGSGHVASVAELLESVAEAGRTTTPRQVIFCEWGSYRIDGNYRIELTGSDDPVVWSEVITPGKTERDIVAPTFSAFLSGDIVREYVDPQASIRRTSRPYGSQPTHANVPSQGWVLRERTEVLPYGNGVWLRVPDEPFPPPVLDFLTEHFGEPEHTPRPHNVTTYTYRPLGGTIRVTADEPTLTGGLSAWWIHADTPERLAEFAELLLPWGTLRATLRTDTIAASAVLKRVRGA